MTQRRLAPRAVADVRHGRRCHDRVEPGVSVRFAESLDELFARLVSLPRSAPPVAGYDDVRRAVVRTFPYVVFHRQRADRIDVLRVPCAAHSDADSGAE